VDLNDFTKNNVCISGVNGDFGPLASYNNPHLIIASFTLLIQKYLLVIARIISEDFSELTNAHVFTPSIDNEARKKNHSIKILE
jgi:hypothetical protein